MLKINKAHKGADLTPIKSKLEKAKIAGKVLVAGVLISGCVLFGNYIGNQAFPNNENGDVPVNYSAVVEKDNQSMIVDLNYYTKRMPKNPLVKSNQYTLVTPDGDRLIVDMDAVTIFTGEDARQQAEEYANQKSIEWDEHQAADYEIIYYQDGHAPGIGQSL